MSSNERNFFKSSIKTFWIEIFEIILINKKKRKNTIQVTLIMILKDKNGKDQEETDGQMSKKSDNS